ncbi:protein phosphatase 2C domain-containing protein [Streptomyces rhizosphaerihabitans]|uniref:protein phosphatase 2C domain-containing protein n=1 Tax=Streptomyces rhizosphaerihabitans TaxID=1266770 RepID=UPI0021C2035D|nr:protein phosphatase 2C domain-containing protein [Streptomyces rhizosphaerihabitans]MCT9005651.1 protein phosphatase 2C domain-containing protein [Streptomyces rhizosphaerihabitans]
MGNDMNATGPSRTSPRNPDMRNPDMCEHDMREPEVWEPDGSQAHGSQAHGNPAHGNPAHGSQAHAGQADVRQPDVRQPDVRQTEFRWPDAQQPDPLDATWQSVDQVFKDQPEPDTAVTAPAPVSVSEGSATRGGPVPTLGAPFHSGPKPPLYAPEPRELPSVRQDPTAALTPDMVVDGAGYGALTVRAASVRGDSHRYQGEPRQDSLAVVRLGAPGADGLLMLAVADGVGSAARSHIGSQEACRLAAMELDSVSADLSETLRAGDETGFAVLVDIAVGRTATLLAHRAREHGDDPAAYATTLRALLVPLDPRVRTRGFLAVGDGGTALLRAGEWNLSLTDPEHDGDGMIDTRTAALPHGHRARACLLAPALPGDVLVLCTDGLSTPLAGDAGMRDFLGSGWGKGAAPAPADFLWQLQYRVKSYDDDRTAVVLWEAVP